MTQFWPFYHPRGYHTDKWLRWLYDGRQPAKWQRHGREVGLEYRVQFGVGYEKLGGEADRLFVDQLQRLRG